jgi:hypothetical protein
MAISDNIKEIADRIAQQVEEGDGSSSLGNDVMGKATLAILGGPADWIVYMRLFSKDEAELARLIPTDGSVDPTRQQARAYLVSNGTCGTGTGSRLLETVSTDLDL